jgi:hypothetical protein
MPGRANYPTGQDILAYLEAASLVVSTALSEQLDTAAEAGRLDFEQRTDRLPFLAGGTDVTRRFDPPRGQRLWLKPDLAVLTSITYQPGGASAETLTLDQDFSLLPFNAVTDEQPFEAVDFTPWRGFGAWASSYPQYRGSLRITGRWGYQTTLPENAWLAILAAGSLSLLPQLSFGLTSGLVEWHEKDRGERYGADPLSSLAAGWQASLNRTVAFYRRVSI